MATAIIGLDRYKTEVTSGGHTIIADEPTASGGTDLGPSPPDFLQVALASCTAITLRMYADRKNIPVEKISVDVSAEKMGNLTLFLRSIHLVGDLTNAQRARFLEIAGSCPVHKILSAPIEIKTVLV